MQPRRFSEPHTSSTSSFFSSLNSPRKRRASLRAFVSSVLHDTGYQADPLYSDHRQSPLIEQTPGVFSDLKNSFKKKDEDELLPSSYFKLQDNNDEMSHPNVSTGVPYPAPQPVATATVSHQPPPAVPDSYFTESRKGEVNELRNLLRNFSTERDPQRKRDIIKKVIAYMTLGIDVSRLFTEMMLAIETRDLVIKKMVYLYLCNYAITHPELAQMCTNTLQKDCGNEDPMVRGLALRALCSLNLPQMVEYISEPLRRSLQDGHAYVRKTGVMGILKLYHLDKEAFERCNFVDILYDMLKDPDSSVVTNCILVLNEVMAKSPNGGMALNRAIMLHLLNRLGEFSEFAVVEVLNLVPRYIPANETEGYQIMNLLDPMLSTSSAGKVLSTIRAFMSLAQELKQPEMKAHVVERVKGPLITLLTAASPELVFVLLHHIEALTDLCPGAFDEEYRQFYLKYHDPTHVQYLKVRVLNRLANPNTAPDIVAELADCIHSRNVTLSRLAVRSMTAVACRGNGGPGCAESIARRLVELVDDSSVPHISSEAATGLTHILRKHESLKSVAAPPLLRSLKYMVEPSGKASLLYLIAMCAENIPNAPYAFEKLIDKYDDIKEADIKLALLNSSVQLFFKQPPQMQHMLGRLLAKATDDVSSQDLHDRALFYYRLLKSGTPPETLQKIVVTNSSISSTVLFAEDDDPVLREALMEEFNTLSVVYGKTAANFVHADFQTKYVKMPPEHPLGEEGPAVTIPSTNEVAPVEDHYVMDQQPQQPEPVPAPANDVVDLLGFGDSPTAAAAPAPAPTNSGFALNASVSMTGEEYQSKWGAIADSDSIVTMVPLKKVPGSTDEVEGALGAKHIMTMASGELPSEFKFFLYAQDASSGSMFLIQSNIAKSSDPEMVLTIKVEGGSGGSDQEKSNKLVEVVASVLG